MQSNYWQYPFIKPYINKQQMFFSGTVPHVIMLSGLLLTLHACSAIFGLWWQNFIIPRWDRFISKHSRWPFIIPPMLITNPSKVDYYITLLQHYIFLCLRLKEVISLSISQHKLLTMYDHIIHKWIQLCTRIWFRAQDFVGRLTETMTSLAIPYWGQVPWW
jgi:hypothetical protein